MAYETELANMVKQTDVVAAMAAKAIATVDSVWPLIRGQAFPENTNVIKFTKLGKIEAAAGTESTALTYGSSHELTDSSISVTGTRKETAVKLTLEQLEFGGAYAGLERAVGEIARAFNRLAASELKTLFSSVSGSITATNVLTKDNLLDARYTVRSTVKGASESLKLVGWFDFKGVNEISKELTDTDASAFVQQVNLGMLGSAAPGQAKGELFDTLIYETDGLPTSASDDVSLVWDPSLAFCSGVRAKSYELVITPPKSQEPWFEVYAYTFWDIKEWHDGAAVRVLSDT